jgi:hypothetical protein
VSHTITSSRRNALWLKTAARVYPSDWYEESNTVCLTQGSVLKGYTRLNSVLVSHQKQTKTVANQAGQLVMESDVNARRKETFGKRGLQYIFKIGIRVR